MIDLYNIYQNPTWFILVLVIAGVWSLIWKGLALWFSARNKQKVWFFIILITNTLGILSIIYLIAFRPKKAKSVDQTAIKRKEDSKKKK